MNLKEHILEGFRGRFGACPVVVLAYVRSAYRWSLYPPKLTCLSATLHLYLPTFKSWWAPHVITHHSTYYWPPCWALFTFIFQPSEIVGVTVEASHNTDPSPAIASLSSTNKITPLSASNNHTRPYDGEGRGLLAVWPVICNVSEHFPNVSLPRD